eukprot:210816-Prymnesium_polylepis.1
MVARRRAGVPQFLQKHQPEPGCDKIARLLIGCVGRRVLLLQGRLLDGESDAIGLGRVRARVGLRRGGRPHLWLSQ